ncbi:MAG: DUF134 domain-containing protein [Zestosphaera sp.]
MPRCMRGPWRCRGRPPVGVKSRLNLEEVFYLPIKTVKGLQPTEFVEVYDYEVEALKLIHLDELSTDEAAARMGVSKATFWRILETCRVKIAEALVEGKPFKLVSKSRENIEGRVSA